MFKQNLTVFLNKPQNFLKSSENTANLYTKSYIKNHVNCNTTFLCRIFLVRHQKRILRGTSSIFS